MHKTRILLQTLENLHHLPRIGGVLFAGLNTSDTDNLAEHSYKVTYISLIFTRLAIKHGYKPDSEKILSYAVTHDWSESIIGDLPLSSPSYQSYFDPEFKSQVHNAEVKAVKAISEYVQDDFDLSLPIDLNEFDKNLVKAADVTALLLEILEWNYRGYKYDWIELFWSKTYTRLSDLISNQLSFLSPLLQEFENAYKTEKKPANPFLSKSTT